MNFNFNSSHKPKAINPDKIVDYHPNLSSGQSSDDLILTSFKFVNYMFKYKKLNETLPLFSVFLIYNRITFLMLIWCL
jgi:hypothetical protein